MNRVNNLWNYVFRNKQKNSASIAKERLQIIVSHERSTRESPDYLPMLQQELLAVIAKYTQVDPSQVRVEVERSGNCSILDLNITLPDRSVAAREMEQISATE